MSDYQLALACHPRQRFDITRVRIALGEHTLIQDRVTVEKLAARYHELFQRYLMVQRVGCVAYVGVIIGVVVVGSVVGTTLTAWWLI